MLKTLSNSLEVLMMFTKEKTSWGGRELATALNENHTKIYRILETFEKHNFLVKDEETKKYSLGMAIWELGRIIADKYKITEVFEPLLEEISKNTGESVFLTKLDHDEGLTLAAVESDNKIRYSVSIGSRAPLYVGASYRAMLAHMSQDFVTHYLKTEELIKYTENTMASHESIVKDLQLIRQQGYAISKGEYTEDVTAIAIPIFYEGKIFGSLTISGPTHRISDDQVTQFVGELRKAEKVLNQTFNRFGSLTF